MPEASDGGGRTNELRDTGGVRLRVGDRVDVLYGIKAGKRCRVREILFAGWRSPPRMHARIDEGGPSDPGPDTGVWEEGRNLRKA